MTFMVNSRALTKEELATAGEAAVQCIIRAAQEQLDRIVMANTPVTRQRAMELAIAAHQPTDPVQLAERILAFLSATS